MASSLVSKQEKMVIGTTEKWNQTKAFGVITYNKAARTS